VSSFALGLTLLKTNLDAWDTSQYIDALDIVNDFLAGTNALRSVNNDMAMLDASGVLICSDGYGSLSTLPPLSIATARATASSLPASTNTSADTGAHRVGERIRLGDEEYLTVTQVDPNVSSTTAFQPAAGNKWVAALLQIEGINPQGATYNEFYCKARDQDGYEYIFDIFGKDPQLQSSNDLQPGAIVQGWVTFEVPVATKSLTLVYQAGFRGEPVEVTLL
jgi:hypothetical protein